MLRLAALLAVVGAPACTAEAITADTTTGHGAPAQECLYDGDCGDQAVCHRGSCILQCEEEACCTLLGDCDPAQACSDGADCEAGELCEAGQCRPAPKPRRVLG